MISGNFTRKGGTGAKAFRAIVGFGADAYDRAQYLPRVLPVGPADIADDSDHAAAGSWRGWRERYAPNAPAGAEAIGRTTSTGISRWPQAYAAERRHLKQGTAASRFNNGKA